MPLVTLTIREGESSEFKSAVLGAVHSALIAAGVPETDRFRRVLELARMTFVSIQNTPISPLVEQTISF
ncbi:MAG TPA: hypothetical protein VI585_11950 [Candidatus Binatia bacterium]